MKKLVIYGAGHSGRYTAIYLQCHHSAEYEVVGFLDDAKNGEVDGIPIMGARKELAALPAQGIDHILVTCFAKPRTRLHICREAEQAGFNFPSFHAKTHLTTKVGKGVCIHPSALLLGGDQQIDDYSMISALAIIEGGVKLGKGVFIAPYVFVGANARLEEGTAMHVRSTCLPGKTIGKYSIIGAHTKVTKSLEERSVLLCP